MSIFRPILLHTWLLCLIVVPPLQALPNRPTDWYVYGEADVSGWKTSMVFDSQGRGWLGGVFNKPTRHSLWFFDGRRWRPRTDFPVTTKRSYVLAVDGQDHCWVVPFAPYTENGDPRQHFDIWHFDGNTWQARPIVKSGLWPQGMAMVDANLGFLVGNNRRIMRLDKTGFKVFQAKPNKRAAALPLSELQKMNFLNVTLTSPSHGFASGSNGLVVEYRDGEWAMLDLPRDMETLIFNRQHVDRDGALWLAAESAVARYHGGKWTSWHDLPTRGPISDLCIQAPDRGYAVGHNGMVLFFDGRSWQNAMLPGDVHAQLIEEDALGNLWILGDGKIYKNTDAGPPKLRAIQTPQAIPFYPSKNHLNMVDANGDERLDLVIADDQSLMAYPNDGLGLYGSPEKLWHLNGQGAVTHGLPAFLFDGNLPEWLVITNLPDTNPLLASGNLGYKVLQNDIAATERSALPDINKVLDLDGDGDLDLYQIQPINTSANHRLVENRNGRMVPLPADTLPATSAFLVWGDLDGDGDLDALDQGFSRETTIAYRNDGHFTFTPFADSIGMEGSTGYGYGSFLLVDFDVDGDLDILSVRDRLEAWQNDSRGFFTKAEERFPNIPLKPDSFGQIVNLGDLNHNGFPEISLALHSTGAHYLLTRTQRGDWVNVADQMLVRPPDAFFPGVDLDHDGDLDLIGLENSRLTFYENQIQGDRAITITLIGPPQNRAAMGADIRLYREHPNGRVDLVGTRAVEAVNHHGWGHSLDRRHHLATPHEGPHRLEVRFNGRLHQSVAEVMPGQHITLQAHPPIVDGLHTLMYRIQLSPRFARLWLEALKLLLFFTCIGLTNRFLVRRKATPLSYPFRALIMAVFPLYGLIALATTAYTAPVQLAAVALYSALIAGAALVECGLPAWYRAHFIGPYKILGIVGEGGMGVVYRARDVVRGRIVALKTFPAELTSDREVRKRFQREAAILKSLQHPNIVPVFETGEFDGRGFIAMELLQGVTLKRIVAEQKQINWRTSLDIFTAIAKALDYIHQQGIQHRDLKAENIFIIHETMFQSPAWRTSSREIASLVSGRLKSDQIKLMDFGLSRHRGTKTLTRGGGLIGTLAYLAPEQIIHRRGDFRSDIYSFGVLMYETVAGRLPYSGSHEISLIGNIRKGAVLALTDTVPELPQPLAQIIMKSLAFSPDQRFSDAQSLYEALADFQEQSRGGAFDQTLINIAPTTGLAAQPPKAVAPPAVTPPASPAPTPESDWPAAVRDQTGQWRAHFLRAKELHAARNLHEAHLAMCECIDDLEKVTVDLSEDHWETYAREFEVEEVMGFMERLNLESG
ncbi:protein kinase domain-containing protein [Acanthopleuribacter pedis]|uniref:Protein kinase n=1 Tax=Acanthopleuribacter pedis TaxID=442870 RepID=A0A8J7U687_9BACT|nr:protein kinase [Acanthopleuribacter pedis]MBO1322532.1 protein kinase [Acanthopleuribacter pedis]